MRIAIFFNDRNHRKEAFFSGMDFRNPQLGNPGIGGTDYEFILLVYALAKFSDCEVNLYCHEESNIYPGGVNVHILDSSSDLVAQVAADGNDILISKIGAVSDSAYSKANDSGLNIIVWAHNFMTGMFARKLAENPAVKRVVMVSHEHYDYYLDHPVIAKSTFIHNMYDGRHFPLREYPSSPAVTYTGGLYEAKGFHVLAAMWKDILREVPDATLYVIGSGRLYDKGAKLGAYGLADAKYEAMFMRHLTEGGEILPSVKFLGNMGAEKSEIYAKTTVGVMNPSGQTETFGMSALDAEACGVPVVSRAYGGLFETVRHGGTGYLGRNPEEIRRYIIMLLKDRELNVRLGRQAKEFAEKSFLPEVIVKKWLALFDDVMNGRPCEYIPPSQNVNGVKRLKIVNRWLHEHHIPTPPVSVLSPRNLQDMLPAGTYASLKRLLHR
ncbi:MAG: glycosyltransferase family 4 protein [Synergistaceae bacterium]|nr:glycosyltransferase family 4 protein [Synergistaceae bacterium]